MSNITLAGTQLPVDKLLVGSHQIPLNYKMTIKEAIKMLGDSSIHQQGDGANGLTWVCYRTSDNKNYSVNKAEAVLILESQELGGGIYITGFQLSRPGLLPTLEKDCTSISVSPEEITTGRGISLGMTRSEIKKILGPPTSKSKEQICYDFSEKKHGPWGRLKIETDYFIVADLKIWFRNDIAVRISGFRADQS